MTDHDAAQIIPEEWQVESICLFPGYGQGGEITVNSRRNEGYDAFSFGADAELTLNHLPVSLDSLLFWFHTAGLNVRATVYRDQRRYGHVTRVEFREEAA